MKMKRSFCLFFVFLLVIPLTACEKSPENIYRLVNALSESFGETHDLSIRYADREEEGFVIADSKALGRLYSGKWETPACMSRISAFAIRLPLDESGFEIHALKCVNLSDTDEVAGLLRKRIERLRNAEIKEYAPESYEMYFVGAEIFTCGDTVFLLATPDNRAAKKFIGRNDY